MRSSKADCFTGYVIGSSAIQGRRWWELRVLKTPKRNFNGGIEVGVTTHASHTNSAFQPISLSSPKGLASTAYVCLPHNAAAICLELWPTILLLTESRLSIVQMRPRLSQRLEHG